MTISVNGADSAMRAEEARKRAAEEARKRAEEEARKRAEEEAKKRAEKQRAEELKAEEQKAAEEKIEEQKVEEQKSSDSIFNPDIQDDKYLYFDKKETSASRGSSTADTISELNRTLEERNEEEKSTSTIHGMSDAEYQEYKDFMYEQYGIQLENGYNYEHFQNVAVAMGESCSQSTRFSAMSKSAQSYDTVLDLVLDAKLTEAISDIFKGDTDPNWEKLCASGTNGRLLKDYGIKIVKCSERQYSISLVDENGNVIQDSEGHLAQVYKNDYLLPDGQAQQNEIQVSAALDAMGFDCWSVMDLSKEEYEMVKEMAQLDNSQLGTSSQFRGDNEQQIRAEVLGTYDKNTKTWSKAKKQDNSAWVNGTYTDTVSGETTGAKKRYSQFLSEQKSGFYKGKHNYDGSSGITGNVSAHGNSSSNSVNYTSNFLGTINQKLFNKYVEKFLHKGLSLSEAQKDVNSIYGSEYSYTGANDTTSKLSQKDYNEKVNEYISAGYTVKSAIAAVNEKYDIYDYEYNGKYKDLIAA